MPLKGQIEQARKESYSDAEIVEYLTQQGQIKPEQLNSARESQC
jgi:hypothetical protein